MTESLLDDEGDLGFVEIDGFHQLQTCFDNLRKSHDNINQNVTMLMELLTNFIKIQSPHDAGNASMPPRPLEHAGDSLVPPPPPKVISNAYTLFFDGALRRGARRVGGGLLLLNCKGEVDMEEIVFLTGPMSKRMQ